MPLEQITIIPNSAPIYIAHAVFSSEVNEGGDPDNIYHYKIVHIDLERIAAWRVTTVQSPQQITSIADPVGVAGQDVEDSEYPLWAIFEADTKTWHIPHGPCGNGLDELLTHWQLEQSQKATE